MAGKVSAKLAEIWASMKEFARRGKGGMKSLVSRAGESIRNSNGKNIILWAIGIIVLIILWLLGSTWLFFPLLIFLAIIFIFTRDVVREHDGLKLLLILGLIALGIFVLLPMIGGNIGFLGPKTFSNIISFDAISNSKFVDFWKNFNPMKSWNAFWNKQVSIASGGYFEGTVEENKEDTRLGIYLEDIKSSDPLLYEGEDAVFWITLRGKAIEEPIPVKIDCNGMLNNKEKIANTNNPKEITIFTYEVDTYDCKFGSLKSGTIKVNFTAEYPFTTLGYTKAYFISQEKLRELWRQDTDPLLEFKVPERDPIAVYTNGPMKIGMGTVMQPVAIKDTTSELSRFGITLESRWEGNIKEIKNVEVQVPRSMDLVDCDHSMTEGSSDGCIKRCNDMGNDGVDECITQCDDYKFYVLDEGGKNRINSDLNSMIKFQTINCYLHANSKSDILGNSPMSTKYFRTVVDYIYVAQMSRTFYVKKLPTTTTITSKNNI
jgi:hypothetical protein